jgi:putative transposase
VKTAGKGEQRGFDGGQKVKGRKCQIAVDTQGNLQHVLLHKANIHDSKGGAVLADIVLTQQKKVQKVLADLGYRGFFEDIAQRIHKRSVEFSRKITGQFVIQRKRWIVECTRPWLNWTRRLAKNFEQKCIYSENIIRISSISLLLRQFH